MSQAECDSPFDVCLERPPKLVHRLAKVSTAIAFSIAGMGLCSGCGTQIGIAASPSEIYVEVGGTAPVNVLAIWEIEAPTPVTEPLTINSSNEAVALVSEQVVTGVSEGTAVLAITDGVFDTAATVHVVAPDTIPAELVITPSSVSCVPDSDGPQLEVFAVFPGGAGEDITDRASYSTADSSIALVTAEGAVVCVGSGTTVITAEHVGVADTIIVSVGPIPPVAVAFEFPTLACEVGQWQEVSVLALWEDETTTDVSLSAEYVSTDRSVAIASQGFIQCINEGAATITADVSGVTGELDVNVQPVTADPEAIVDLRISPASVECSPAQPAEFTVIADYGDGRTADVTEDDRTQYQTSNSNVALVIQNQVVCIGQGQATVQATFGEFAATVTVNVR